MVLLFLFNSVPCFIDDFWGVLNAYLSPSVSKKLIKNELRRQPGYHQKKWHLSKHVQFIIWGCLTRASDKTILG